MTHVYDVLGDVESMGASLEAAQVFMGDKPWGALQSQYWRMLGRFQLRSGSFSQAVESFTKAEDEFLRVQNLDKALRVRVQRAHVHIQNLDFPRAEELLRDVLTDSPDGSPHAFGEAHLLLGRLARDGRIQEKPLTCFMTAFDFIARQPVSELTWQILFSLAVEFTRRGQMQKGRDGFVKTKAVIEFFLSHFQSSDLREQYLSTDGRRGALEECVQASN